MSAPVSSESKTYCAGMLDGKHGSISCLFCSGNFLLTGRQRTRMTDVRAEAKRQRPTRLARRHHISS